MVVYAVKSVHNAINKAIPTIFYSQYRVIKVFFSHGVHGTTAIRYTLMKVVRISGLLLARGNGIGLTENLAKKIKLVVLHGVLASYMDRETCI